MTKLIIADDSRATLAAALGMIRANAKYNVVGTLPGAGEALAFCHTGQAELVLMKGRFRNGDSGFAAARAIKKADARIRVIIISDVPEESFPTRARRALCDGLWFFAQDGDTLTDTMDKVMSGQTICPKTPPQVRLGLAYGSELTAKEKEVARLLATDPDCRSYQDIADKMGIKERTVRFHLNNIQEKTGIYSVPQLCFELAETGFMVKLRDDLS